MQTTETKAWSTAVERIGQEYSLTKLSFEKGSIPLDLNGSIYFNGPAQLERNGQKVGHWFDGDGAVLGIHFHQGTAQGVYRYVQTQAYQEETKANRFLYGNYGSPPPPPFWNRILRPIKETANTSVLALPNKLLALQEGSWPYALDLMTLETMGKDDLGGLNSFYSAHPKRDALTQDIYNFGLSLGLTTTLHLYRQDKNGKILKTQQFSLKKIPLIHDFCLAGNYLVFLISPVYCDLWPVFGQGKSFSDALRWHPEKGTQILIF